MQGNQQPLLAAKLRKRELGTERWLCQGKRYGDSRYYCGVYPVGPIVWPYRVCLSVVVQVCHYRLIINVVWPGFGLVLQLQPYADDVY